LLAWPEVHRALGILNGQRNPVPFIGIGPDGIRMSRGDSLPWPYNADGTINEIYFEAVDTMERHKKIDAVPVGAHWLIDLIQHGG